MDTSKLDAISKSLDKLVGKNSPMIAMPPQKWKRFWQRKQKGCSP